MGSSCSCEVSSCVLFSGGSVELAEFVVGSLMTGDLLNAPLGWYMGLRVSCPCM